MNDMSKKLTDAGLDTARSRLNTVADTALARGKNTLKAMQDFRLTVMTDAELMVALVGKDELTRRCNEFLSERERLRGASPNSADSQQRTDRPAPSNDSRPSQRNHDRHQLIDRPTVTSKPGAASQGVVEIQLEDDRRPRTPAKLSEASRKRISQSGVFAKRISAHLELTYGEMTPWHYMNLGISNAWMATLHTELANHIDIEAWIASGMHTPLTEFADAGSIERLDAKVTEARERAVQAAKGLKNAANG